MAAYIAYLRFKT